MSEKKEKEILIAVEVDAETGVVIERPFTADEIKFYNVQVLLEQNARLAEQAKLDNRLSALSKLAALGLTAEEIAAL